MAVCIALDICRYSSVVDFTNVQTVSIGVIFAADNPGYDYPLVPSAQVDDIFDGPDLRTDFIDKLIDIKPAGVQIGVKLSQ